MTRYRAFNKIFGILSAADNLGETFLVVLTQSYIENLLVNFGQDGNKAVGTIAHDIGALGPDES